MKEVIDIRISVLHRVVKIYPCQCFLDIINHIPYFRLHPHSFFCNSNIFVYTIYFVERNDSETEFNTRYDAEETKPYKCIIPYVYYELWHIFTHPI